METLSGYPWRIGFRQRILGAANLVDSPRGRFTIPAHPLFVTFALRISELTLGSITNAKLRVGFTSPPLNRHGVDFPGLVATDDARIASVGYDIGAAAPAVPGNYDAQLGQVVQVFLTSPGVGGRNFVYDVLYTCAGYE